MTVIIMDHLSRSQGTAVNQVLGAVAMLNEKNGTTIQDIIYILDSLHDKKVQRPAVQNALRNALKRGLLTCLNNRYKVQRKKKPMSGRKASQVHKVVNKRLNHSKGTTPRVPHSIARPRRSKNVNKLSGNGVPMRNFECSTSCKEKSKMNYKNYNFKEVDNITQWACSTNAHPEPTRKRIKRSTKEKQTDMSNSDNFKKSSSSDNFEQNYIEHLENEKECYKKDKKRGKAANEHREVVERSGTPSTVNQVSKKFPVGLERSLSQAKRSRYNLRPRVSFRPQELSCSLKNDSQNRVKQEKDKESSQIYNTEEKSSSKFDNSGGYDNNGDNICTRNP